MSTMQSAVLSHLNSMGVQDVKVHYNLSPSSYEEFILKDSDNRRSSLGAVAIKTGKFTGRSPKDRYIVKDDYTAKTVDWGNINKGISPEVYEVLQGEIKAFLSAKEIFVHDAFACADRSHQLNIRTVCEKAYSGLFASNMFRDLTDSELETFQPEWTILCAPGFKAKGSHEGLANENFAILNFSKKEIIIGGTGYTGEIKKGIFSVLNYILPTEKNVLSMHCSANVGDKGDAAIFFGLSGTGKTTLSADPDRLLIGDDEHGWSDNGIFNFEGGCYAKTIDLDPKREPQIYGAIKPGALIENVGFVGDSNVVDFSDTSITENTRVSYPLSHIPEAKDDSQSGQPQNVFFLTCDAFGVLPPVSKLTKEQAMYYFISGYTAKVAGTELGVTEPQATFSACFGAPFLPLHPTKYAEMLGNKLDKHNVNIWLINTGWTEGAYGKGHRISLKYTRAIITNALNGNLAKEDFEITPGFNLAIPKRCKDVPTEILNPRNTWADKNAYDHQAEVLITLFQENFQKYAMETSEAIMQAEPRVLV